MHLLTGRTNRCFPGASVLEETDTRQINSHLTEAVPEVGAKTEKKRELGARTGQRSRAWALSQTQVPIPVLSLKSHVTLGKLLDVPEPQFLHL